MTFQNVTLVALATLMFGAVSGSNSPLRRLLKNSQHQRYGSVMKTLGSGRFQPGDRTRLCNLSAKSLTYKMFRDEEVELVNSREIYTWECSSCGAEPSTAQLKALSSSPKFVKNLKCKCDERFIKSAPKIGWNVRVVRFRDEFPVREDQLLRQWTDVPLDFQGEYTNFKYLSSNPNEINQWIDPLKMRFYEKNDEGEFLYHCGFSASCLNPSCDEDSRNPLRTFTQFYNSYYNKTQTEKLWKDFTNRWSLKTFNGSMVIPRWSKWKMTTRIARLEYRKLTTTRNAIVGLAQCGCNGYEGITGEVTGKTIVLKKGLAYYRPAGRKDWIQRRGGIRE